MNWFWNLNTKAKLMLSFASVCVIAAVGGAFTCIDILHVQESLRVVYEDYTVASNDLAKAAANLAQFSARTDAVVECEDRAACDKAIADQDRIRKAVTASLDAYAATVLRVSRSGRSEAHDLEIVRKAVSAYFDQGAAVAAKATQRLAAASSEEKEAILVAVHKAASASRDALEAAETALEELVTTVGAVASDMNEDGRAEAHGAIRTSVISTVFMVIGGLLLGATISTRIARPLGQAAEVLSHVAQGDFTSSLQIKTSDEVGRMSTALNDAVTSMRTTLCQVRSTAEGVATASRELSAASTQISSGAQEQASSLEQTAATLEEMTSTVRQNAENAQQASQLAGAARDVAENGGRVVNQAVNAMSEINTASKKIAEIITTIDEIAFQTNLLALNAAVEAARAGEQGRGFAVVASEVRNLAQRSATAAKEIKGLIQDSVQKVEGGSELVNKSGATLTEIVTAVKRVTDIISEIASASREQATGVEQVNRAVSQMDSVTQSNASQTEEMSGTAESLAQQSEQLRGIVARFRVDLDGAAAPPPAAHEVPKARPAASPSRPVASAHKPQSHAPRAAAPAAPASKPKSHDNAQQVESGLAALGREVQGDGVSNPSDLTFEDF